MKKIVVGDCFQSGKDTIIVERFECPNGIDLVVGFHVQERVEIGFRPSVLAGIELPTLHLPIGNDQKRHGGKWFGMILSGEKTEEYREIAGRNGTYKNVGMLTTCREGWASYHGRKIGEGFSDWLKTNETTKPFKAIHLTNGYGHHRPQLWAHIEEITIGRGKPEWGAPTDRNVFIIKLGEVFHTKNLKVVN